MEENHEAPEGSSSGLEIVAIVCFFLSGFAGLVYEVCWIRKASLVFGSTTFAVSTVLAVFFLGLAVGSYLFGRIGIRIARPLRLYAWMEIALGLLALLSLVLFDWTDSIYGGLYRSLGQAGAGLLFVRVLLVSLILLPPTILMGGTLPLFCRHFVRDRGAITRSVGWLYGVNTLGAAAGCATTGLLLLESLGLFRTLQVGAALSVLCGVVVVALRVRPAKRIEPLAAAGPDRRSGDGLVSLLFFAVGFAALGGEVLWTRFLALVVRNTVYTYTLTLAVVLLGIFFGSVLASRIFDRRRSLALAFGVMQILAGLTMMAMMLLPPDLWRGLGGGLWVYATALSLPALFSGASFPLAVRMVVRHPERSSLGVGRMAAVNTLGGILGSLVVGFAGIPWFGLQASLFFVVAVSLLSGSVAVVRLSGAALGPRAAVVGGAIVLAVGIPLVADTRIPADFLGSREALVDFREGYGSNLAVVRREGHLNLEIDRWWQGVDHKTEQFMAAHIPMLLHDDPKHVLVVGVGVGQTAGRFLMYDIDVLDCVDIEPTIFDFIEGHFDSAWMGDERVSLIREDGRSFLSHSGKTYDVVSLELGQIVRPGIAFFYTSDFYLRARERLAPRGLLVQSLPLQWLSQEHVRGAVATFIDVFPQSMLWYNGSELLLIGVNAEAFRIDPQAVTQRMRRGEVLADLDYAYWGGRRFSLSEPTVLLASYLMGPSGLASLAANGPTYVDDRPRLDYGVRDKERSLQDELEGVADIKDSLDPVDRLLDLPPRVVPAVNAVRQRNVGELAVSPLIRRALRFKQREDWGRTEELLRQALQANPDHAVANHILADTLVAQERLNEAGKFYTRAVRLRPDDGTAHHAIAQIHHRQARMELALEHYRIAVELLPDDADVHNNLGAALAEQGDYQGAIRHFETALRLRPGDTRAEENLALVRSALGDAPE